MLRELFRSFLVEFNIIHQWMETQHLSFLSSVTILAANPGFPKAASGYHLVNLCLQNCMQMKEIRTIGEAYPQGPPDPPMFVYQQSKMFPFGQTASSGFCIEQ